MSAPRLRCRPGYDCHDEWQRSSIVSADGLAAMIAASQATWYLSRGSGAVSLVLLTFSFVLGIPTLLSWGIPRAPRLVVQLMHRNISLLVLVFLAVHIATSVLDSFVSISVADAFVPFGGTYRPLWLGLGALAMDFVIAVIVTSLLRPRVSYVWWKRVHWLAYACWPIAVVHGLGTGTDTRYGWMQILVGACAAVVLASIAWRLAARPLQDPRRKMATIGSVVGVPMIIIVWLFAGPMHADWGKTHKTAVTPVSTQDVGTETTNP